MLTLPDEYNTLFAHFRPFFSKRVWPLASLLLVGAILAPGKRTVTAVLRIMGLSQEKHFQNFHGAQPGGLVEPGLECLPAAAVAEHLSAARAGRAGDRRND